MSTYTEGLCQLIKKIREQQSGFGALSILAELEHKYHYPSQALPHRSTVAAYLNEQGLTQKYESHTELPVKPCKEALHTHDLWQLDARGNEDAGSAGYVALLDIKDVYSNTYVCCFPAKMKSKQSHPSTSDYQTALRLAFLRFGLPKRIQVDHASVFHENSSKSPFPTRLHLWLTGLGIELCFSRVHQPTDQAQVERAHQILFNQVLNQQDEFDSWEQLYEKCQQRCFYLNHYIPSRSCNNLPPLVALVEAKHSGRYYHPHKEKSLLDMKKIYALLAKCKWYRKVAANNTISLGNKVYYLPIPKAKQQLEITFCACCSYLLFHDDNERLVGLKPIKEIDPLSLMGPLGQIYKLPALQLPIAFDWELQKISTTLSDSS